MLSLTNKRLIIAILKRLLMRPNSRIFFVCRSSFSSIPAVLKKNLFFLLLADTITLNLAMMKILI